MCENSDWKDGLEGRIGRTGSATMPPGLTSDVELREEVAALWDRVSALEREVDQRRYLETGVEELQRRLQEISAALLVRRIINSV